MAHEPSALVGYAEHPVNLVRAHTFLARRHKLKREDPLVERYVRSLEHGAYGDGELSLAPLALIEPRALTLAAQRICRTDHTAMRAYWTFRPQQCFKPRASGVRIPKDRIVEERHRRLLNQ